MSEVSSSVAAKQAAFADKLSPCSLGGRVRTANGYYDGKTADAAGTVINLCKLPRGARVLPSSKVYFAAGQTATTTFKAGDAGDDDRYLAATAAGASKTSLALDGNALGDYVLADEGWITVTTGVNALADGVRIAFDIYYVID